MPESALVIVPLCLTSFLQLPQRVVLGVHFAASLAIFTRPITTGLAPVARIPVVMEAKMKYLTGASLLAKLQLPLVASWRRVRSNGGPVR